VFGDPEWKKCANKAIEIFEVTTSIAGHDASHDEVMKILKDAIKNIRKIQVIKNLLS
jgi:hypothetical protein